MNRSEIRVLGLKKSAEECLFHVGQIVRLKTGRSPQRVMEIIHTDYHGWKLVCQYLSDTQNYELHYRKPRDQHDFVAWNDALEEFNANQEKETVMTDLYQVKGAVERFGTKLTENSQGQFVLEMKGEGGKVEAFNPGDLELVVPYTIQLDCVVPGESGMHIQCEKGKVEKNDLLMSVTTGRIFRVSNVDTKNRSPKAGPLQFLKIQGEHITL